MALVEQSPKMLSQDRQFFLRLVLIKAQVTVGLFVRHRLHFREGRGPRQIVRRVDA
jgi:hypothetical protein